MFDRATHTKGPTLALRVAGAIVLLVGIGLVSVAWTQRQVDPDVAGQSGPAIGSEPAVFLPMHISGSHAGQIACPLCVHGRQPGVAIWARQHGLDAARTIAIELDAALSHVAPRFAVGYVVFVPPAGQDTARAQQTLKSAFDRTPLEHVFLVVARPDRDGPALDTYNISTDPAIATSTIVYANRQVQRVWTNLGTDSQADASGVSGIGEDSPDNQERAAVSHQRAALGETCTLLTKALVEALAIEEPYAESAVHMCDKNEPGTPMMFWGQVRDDTGRPMPDVAVNAWNADRNGLYTRPDAGSSEPRIAGTSTTDARGWYRFTTVRPGGYPGRPDPEHIHMGVTVPGKDVHWVAFWFHDDPRVTDAMRTQQDNETVIVSPRLRDGAQVFRYDVVLPAQP